MSRPGKTFAGDESGAELVEYALLIGILVFGIYGVLAGTGGSIDGLLQALIAKLNTVNFL